MIFHKEKKLCMFLPPKNGTFSTRAFLKKSGWIFLNPPHVYPEMLLKKYTNLSSYKYFAFMRHPIDKFESAMLFTKKQPGGFALVEKMISQKGFNCTVENLTYDQFIDGIDIVKNEIMFQPQVKWFLLPGTEVLNFDNFESELRRISGDYVSPLEAKNVTGDFGKSVITQKVIDFVKTEYAADCAFWKERFGREIA
jgi:hypothetical protein